MSAEKIIAALREHGPMSAAQMGQRIQVKSLPTYLSQMHRAGQAEEGGRARWHLCVLKLFGINEQKTRELIIEERKQTAKKAREEAKTKKTAAVAAKKKKRPVDKINAAIERRVKKAKGKKKPAAKKAKKK